MSESNHKIVFLELEEIGAAAPCMNLQLKFPVSNSLLSDSKKVVEAIKVKKPHMHELLSRGKVVLQIESDLFPGKFHEVGEDSPIKDRSCLKCTVTRPSPFDLENPQRECVKLTHTGTQIDGNKSNFKLLYLYMVFKFFLILGVQQQGDPFTNQTSSNDGGQEQVDTFRNESMCNEQLMCK